MERFPKIEYTSPKDARESDIIPQHYFDLESEGRKIGGAEVNYYSKPLPHYQLSELYVDPEFQGIGYGAHLMEQVEAFLLERKKPGVLVDAILPDNNASGMYARRGWKEVPGTYGAHVFNWPENVDTAILKENIFRYTDPLERQSRK